MQDSPCMFNEIVRTCIYMSTYTHNMTLLQEPIEFQFSHYYFIICGMMKKYDAAHVNIVRIKQYTLY